MKNEDRLAIAYFISAHGLGHAARAAAVMAAVHQVAPAVRFEIFTTAPHWFFDDCLAGPFACHLLETDVGLIQKSPLEENLPATIKALTTLSSSGGRRGNGASRVAAFIVEILGQ